MNFYKRHIGDIGKSCGHLSQGQMGAYDLLLDWLYGNEKPLPASREALHRIGRAVTKAERENVDAVLSEFFLLSEEGYTQKRATKEIAKANAQADTNRRIAEEREAAKRARTEHESLNESCTNRQPSQTPDTRQEQRPKKELAPKGGLLDGISPEVAADFKALRSKLRAPITATAMNGIRREAALAGLDLEAALVVCCERGWRGFKAEWLREARAGPPPNQPFGKTAQAISQLQAMKNELAENRTADRIPEAALPGPGPDSRR